VTVQPLLLVAASGLARETVEAVRAARSYDPVGILDDDPRRWGTTAAGVPVRGPAEAAAEMPEAAILLCAGSGTARAAIAARLAAAGVGEHRYATVVHPAAVVPASTVIGAGTIVLAGAVLTADVTVGRHVVVMPNAVLTHDDELADYVTVCAAVALAGAVRVGTGAYLGAGSLVRERCTVGARAVLGMGAVAVRDVPAGEVWVGNPARPLVRAMAVGGAA
jgi:sugar O-acyltransferase (sialic acid O-acetyltransferase NeuD family)